MNRLCVQDHLMKDIHFILDINSKGGGEHEDRIRTIRHRYIASVT